MTELIDLPEIGKLTDREKKLIDYITESLANYIEKYGLERRELIACLFFLCTIVFTVETSFNLKEQCGEIDDFCHYLKSKALESGVSCDHGKVTGGYAF